MFNTRYLIVGLVLFTGGCVSMTELTHLIRGNDDRVRSTFVDVVGPGTVKGKGFKVVSEGEGQVTIVHNEGAYREGVTAENRNAFTYKWNGGLITLNGESFLDNTARADLLARISDNQRAVLETLAPGFLEAATAGLGPLLSYLSERNAGRVDSGETALDPLLAFLGDLLDRGANSK